MTDAPETVRDIVPDLASFEFYAVESWHREDVDSADPGQSIPLAWLKPSTRERATFVGSKYLSGSAYSGGALVRANLRAWDEALEGKEGVPAFKFHGEYRTDGRLLRLDRPTTDETRDTIVALIEILTGLDEYPSADDEATSEVEQEDELEAWTAYACRDFLKELGTALDLPDAFNGADPVLAREYFAALAERGNVNGWPGIIHEDTGPYFMGERVASHATLSEAISLGMLSMSAEDAIRFAIDEPDRAGDLLDSFDFAKLWSAVREALAGRWATVSESTDRHGRSVLEISRYSRTVRLALAIGNPFSVVEPDTGRPMGGVWQQDTIRGALAPLFEGEKE